MTKYGMPAVCHIRIWAYRLVCVFNNNTSLLFKGTKCTIVSLRALFHKLFLSACDFIKPDEHKQVCFDYAMTRKGARSKQQTRWHLAEMLIIRGLLCGCVNVDKKNTHLYGILHEELLLHPDWISYLSPCHRAKSSFPPLPLSEQFSKIFTYYRFQYMGHDTGDKGTDQCPEGTTLLIRSALQLRLSKNRVQA